LRKVLLYILQGTAGTTTKQKLLKRNIYKYYVIIYFFLLLFSEKMLKKIIVFQSCLLTTHLNRKRLSFSIAHKQLSVQLCMDLKVERKTHPEKL